MRKISFQEGLTLFSVALGLFIVVIDVTIVNIALPSLSHQLEAPFSTAQWVVIIYTLVLTGLVPICGRLSDLWGRKRLFIAGEILFALSSLLAAQSTSISFLIFARVVQAFGAALISSTTLAIITDTFPPGRRGVAIGIQSILISGGAAVGPSLGGFLVTHYGWQSIFYINIPIGAIGALISLRFLKESAREPHQEKLDMPGAFFFLLGTGALLFGLTEGAEYAWPPESVFSLLVGILILALFTAYQLRVQHPLIDFRLFQNRDFAFAQLAGILSMVALAGTSFLMPFYWQNLRGFDAQTAGLLMLPMPVTFMFVSPIAGKISDRRGTHWLATGGLVLVAFTLYLLTQLDENTPPYAVVLRFILLGVGLGIFMAPNNSAIMSSVSPGRRGIASGLLGMFRYFGQSLGVALAGAILNHSVRGEGGASGAFARILTDLPAGARLPASVQTAFTHGFRTVFWLYVPLALVGAFLSFQRHEKKHGL